MSVKKLIKDVKGDKRFSFEVLPPLKGNGTSNLFSTIDKLKDYAPLFINITTHHSEYVYTELDNGQYERKRIRRRPGTVAIAAAGAYLLFDIHRHILCFIICGIKLLKVDLLSG